MSHVPALSPKVIPQSHRFLLAHVQLKSRNCHIGVGRLRTGSPNSYPLPDGCGTATYVLAICSHGERSPWEQIAIT